jgi:mono/diheme cytochrome c family protein
MSLPVLRISLICLLLAAAGCAVRPGTRGATPIPDAESPAARVYAEHCGACHAVPHPARLAYPGWVQLLPLMERRMAERGMPPLSEAKRNEILAYLKAHAR